MLSCLEKEKGQLVRNGCSLSLTCQTDCLQLQTIIVVGYFGGIRVNPRSSVCLCSKCLSVCLYVPLSSISKFIHSWLPTRRQISRPIVREGSPYVGRGLRPPAPPPHPPNSRLYFYIDTIALSDKGATSWYFCYGGGDVWL